MKKITKKGNITEKMSKKTFEPIIKWSGSKRSQSEAIVNRFPREIETYYEPFVGSAAVLRRLLNEVEKGNIKCNKFICSDLNGDLIDMWNLIKENPHMLFGYYSSVYETFSQMDIQNKKEFYKRFVNVFNNIPRGGKEDNGRTMLFFWIRRTAYNGLVRYNSKGEFNAPCHFTRNGIEPKKLEPILMEWSKLLNKYDVQFVQGSYNEVASVDKIGDNDYLYLDPPYENATGMYNSDGFDHTKFREWLKELPHFALSYDGRTNKEDFTSDMRGIGYQEHVYLESGNSSYRRLKEDKDVEVFESLYLK